MRLNPDPRLDEIQARLSKSAPGTWEVRGLTNADVRYLLAELRKAREALGRVEALAHRWETVPALRKGTAAADLRAAVAAAKGDERG